MFPKDIRYTTTHEWIRIEDGEATVGITAYAANQLSDINYVELPSVGEELIAETALGTIESTEAAVDLLSPVDGEVVETNDAVIENPELIAEDPYDDGWLVRLKPTDPSQVDELMTAEEYQIFVQAEAGDETEEEEEEEEEVEPVKVIEEHQEEEAEEEEEEEEEEETEEETGDVGDAQEGPLEEEGADLEDIE